DDPWFRPVDLQLGPDGALYIADFYNCIIGHYEVPLTHPRRDRDRGRIWRVVYKGDGAGSVASRIGPDFTRATVAELVALLNDPNLNVRVQATEQLAGRCAPESPELLLPILQQGSATQRAHGMWILERLGKLADPLVIKLLDDPEALVRVHVVKALAERSDWGSGELKVAARLREKLADPDAFVVRAAAEALGRHPDVTQVCLLHELLNRTPADDTHLIHVARIALREHLLEPGMYAKLADAANQDPKLAARLADVSLGVPTPEAGAYLLAHLVTGDVPRELIGPYLHHVSRHIAADQVPSIYAYAEVFQEADPTMQLSAVRAMHQGAQERGSQTPGVVLRWGQQLTRKLLETNQADGVRDGIALAQELRIAETFDAVASAASKAAKFPDLRPAAVDACLHVDSGRAIELLSAMLADPAEPLAIRQKAAQALATINNDAARAELVRQLATAPERLAVDIAVGLAGSPEGARLLFDAVRGGKTSGQVLREQVVVARLQGHRRPAIDATLDELTASLPPREERLAQLIDSRREGFHQANRDPETGRALFKKVCAACHKVGGEGNKIGPELDGVGVRGLDRLLEDVLDPNRNVDQAFRSTIVATTDGRTYTGLALREEGNVLVLADNQGKEVRVPLDEIDQRAVSPISPMPANVPDLMTESEFYHLAEFLLSQRQPAAEKPVGK
ncbi:MAG: HEAT repeat domain-containing protein, partial [Planctomycetaceae bacterium]|nr:HEAT repeat domain-containing protein [Planctomycetaceae bacterium]